MEKDSSKSHQTYRAIAAEYEKDVGQFQDFNNYQQSTRAFLIAAGVYLVFLFYSLVTGVINILYVEFDETELVILGIFYFLNICLIVMGILLIIIKYYENYVKGLSEVQHDRRKDYKTTVNDLEENSVGRNSIRSKDSGSENTKPSLPARSKSALVAEEVGDGVSWLEVGVMWKALLMDFFYVLSSLFFCTSLLLKLEHGLCEEETSFVLRKHCNSAKAWDDGIIPSQDLSLVIMLLPIAFNIFVRITRPSVLLTSGFITMSSLCASMVWVHYRHVLPLIIIYGVIGLGTYYEINRQNLAVYSLAKRLHETLSENERLADQSISNELRAMVGNVAHDLKTPLTSFMSGVDLMEHMIEDCQERLKDTDLGASIIEEQIEPMRCCLNNVQDTNSFMIMTINRCIDYTKASKGMRLVPKPETIDLRETIELPLRVMRNLQQRLEINLDESKLKNICSHIITDKQWFQENILCLLSNAVKYSTKGSVDIQISLATKSRIIKLQPRQKMKKDQSKYLKSNVTEAKVQQESADLKRTPSQVLTRMLSMNKATNWDDDLKKSPRVSQSAGSSMCHENDDSRQHRLNFWNHVVSKKKHLSSGSASVSAGRSSGHSSLRSSGRVSWLEQIACTVRSAGRNSNSSPRKVLPTENDDNHSVSIDARSMADDNSTNGCDSKLPCTPKHNDLFVLVEIQDTGIGLSDEAMRNLFNPFKQAQRLAGGTGLGLYSLARRLEALGGHYGVRKRKDKQQGSLFWFAFLYRPDEVSASMMSQPQPRRSSLQFGIRLSGDHSNNPVIPQLQQALTDVSEEKTPNDEKVKPDRGAHVKFIEEVKKSSTQSTSGIVTNEENDAVSKPPSGPVLAPLASPRSNFPLSVQKIMDQYNISSNLDILLVDDSISILKMTSVMLKRHGHRVTQAENGAEAVELMLEREQQGQPFDFVVMDLQMPVMDGLEAARRLRLNEKDLAVKYPRDRPYHHFVIGCSANSDDETHQAALRAGVDAFMCKPFSVEAFYEILGKVYSTNSSQ